MSLEELLKIEGMSVTLEAPGARLYWDEGLRLWCVMEWGTSQYRKRPHWKHIEQTTDLESACRAFKSLFN